MTDNILYVGAGFCLGYGESVTSDSNRRKTGLTELVEQFFNIDSSPSDAFHPNTCQFSPFQVFFSAGSNPFVLSLEAPSCGSEIMGHGQCQMDV